MSRFPMPRLRTRQERKVVMLIGLAHLGDGLVELLSLGNFHGNFSYRASGWVARRNYQRIPQTGPVRE